MHSSSQDQRRQKRLERELQESYATLEATVRTMAQQTYCCRADAETAAQKLRALSSAYHQGDVVVEACPQYGPGRPSRHKPRSLKALTYRLRPTLRAQAEVILRKHHEAACFVVLPNVPTQGEMAHSAREVLHASKNQVKDRIRLWRQGVRDRVMEFCCALHNFRVCLSPWQPMI